MFDQLYARWFGQRKPRRNRTRTQPLLRMPVKLTLERLEQREVLSNTPFPIGYFSLSPVVGAPGQTVTVTESVTIADTPISASISGATWSGGNATFTTSATNAYQAGYRVIVSGVAPYGYDGVYNISSATSTSFVVPLASNPGSFTTAGTSTVGLVPNNTSTGINTITAASWSSSNGGVATFTTSGTLSSSYVSGALVTVSGLTGSRCGVRWHLRDHADEYHHLYRSARGKLPGLCLQPHRCGDSELDWLRFYCFPVTTWFCSHRAAGSWFSRYDSFRFAL